MEAGFVKRVWNVTFCNVDDNHAYDHKLMTGDVGYENPADAVVEEIRASGGKAIPSFDSVLDGKKILQTAINAYGHVDILVNNVRSFDIVDDAHVPPIHGYTSYICIHVCFLSRTCWSYMIWDLCEHVPL
jgi:hypothetical protein